MNQAVSFQVVSVYELKGDSLPEIATHSGPDWWAAKGTAEAPAQLGQATISDDWFQDAPTLLVTDVDSTLIEEEVIDQLAELAGRGQQVAEITESAMSGQIGFAESLRSRVALLKGLNAGAFEEVFSGLHVRPGALELFRWIQNGGGQVAAVSGGFTPVVAMLAKKLGIDHVRAIDLETKEGSLTGRVKGQIVTEKSKSDFLENLQKETGFRSVALGDGANDLRMLHAADLGIGINAKQIVRDNIPNYLVGARLDPVIGLLGHNQPV